MQPGVEDDLGGRVRGPVILTGAFSAADIRGAVNVHRREISQGFLSSLGPGALGLIFSLAAKSRFGVLLIARDPERDEVCGFLLGTSNTDRFYRDFLLRKSIAALWVLLPKLLSLANLRKALETLLYPSQPQLKDLPKAELLDIAIAESQRGTGLAQTLFRQFSGILAAQGIAEFRITTGEELVRAQRFYEALGARKITSLEVHRGSETIVYTFRSTGHEALA